MPGTAAGNNRGVAEHPGDPVAAAAALVGRVLPPGAAGQFELSLLPRQPGGAAAMRLGSQGGKVWLQGTGGVELASALNWYMNEYLNATFDWNTYANGQLDWLGAPSLGRGALPLPLPATSSVRLRRVP